MRLVPRYRFDVMSNLPTDLIEQPFDLFRLRVFSNIVNNIRGFVYYPLNTLAYIRTTRPTRKKENFNIRSHRSPALVRDDGKWPFRLFCGHTINYMGGQMDKYCDIPCGLRTQNTAGGISAVSKCRQWLYLIHSDYINRKKKTILPALSSHVNPNASWTISFFF